MDTSKITRIEVVDHTKSLDNGGGRVYAYWSQYDKKDIKNPMVEVVTQDEGRTLKIFISKKIKN